MHDLDENPFVKHDHLLREDHGAAVAVQALVRHLFCADEWPCDVSKVLRGYGTDIANIGLEMQVWYAENGESDSVFLEVAGDLVARTMAAQERYEEQQRNGCQRRAGFLDDRVCGEPVATQCGCGARLCDECVDEHICERRENAV